MQPQEKQPQKKPNRKNGDSYSQGKPSRDWKQARENKRKF